jgi:GNAT superfamily N-acetyltransferase
VAHEIRIEEWRPATADREATEHDIADLGALLRAVVYGGAGVSFFVPFSLDAAQAFWRDRVLPAILAGTRRVVIARDEVGHIVGTVQIDLATPPNQPHRADVAKMLVHPDQRRRGIARALMVELERLARASGRTLLTLDTVTGSAAEPLYRSLGYVTVGMIPGYARAALSEELESTTIMYKRLE